MYFLCVLRGLQHLKNYVNPLNILRKYDLFNSICFSLRYWLSGVFQKCPLAV